MPDESRPLIKRLTARRGAGLLSVTAVLALALSASIPVGVAAQAPRVTRTDVIRAEDARGKGPDGIKPIVTGLTVPSLRLVSIRAIGRLERPDLLAHITPFLLDAPLAATTADAIAQSLRGLSMEKSASDRALVDSVFALLKDRLRAEPDWMTKGVIARSIGRLPYSESKQAREAEAALVSAVAVDPERKEQQPALEGIAHGLYTLARSRRTLGDPSPATIEWLRRAANYRAGVRTDAAVRRAAWLALAAAGGADKRTVEASVNDTDPQVRRLVVAALPNVQDVPFQREQLDRAALDRDAIVRLEWIRVYRQLFATTDCKPLLVAMTDTVNHVRLAAIDALGAECPAEDAVNLALVREIENGPSGASRRTGGGISWHGRAHALLSLARINASQAQELLRRDGRHPVWQVRMYVARGAAAIKDSTLLSSLAFDSVGSVREAAIQGLSTSVGHLADLVYVRALGSRDYHVVLAAARALRGAPVKDSVRKAVVDALERITRENRQTSRDPRAELLARVREIGTRQELSRLLPLLTDSDEAIAYEAARVLNHFDSTGKHVASSKPVAQSVAPAQGPVRLRVTMSPATGGGTFDLQLDGDLAPMTVARVLQLVRRRYYDGLTFHRVVPNFVVQGGSPGMNEYVGDGPFMRDEVSLAHHDRYTLGTSTRGRDTGDAQFFINLVDNYRLDHDYTVFGKVVTGVNVVDRILEGDVMQSVRIVPTTQPQ